MWTRLSTLVVTAALTTATACLREGAPPIAPVDVSVADVGDGGAAALSASNAPGASKDRCTAKLAAKPIDTGAGCTLDERISKGPGMLQFPCAGTGPAVAVFGAMNEHRFEGAMNDGKITVDLTTELDWEDGCHWKTQQHIRGELHAGNLAWTYTEAPISGSGCYGSCKASAEIEVEGPAGGAD